MNWAGSTIKKSTGNAFDLSAPRAVDMSDIYREAKDKERKDAKKTLDGFLKKRPTAILGKRKT